MTILKALNIGLIGNEMSKKVTGSSDVSLGRTAVSAACGGALGAAAAGTLVVGGAALGAVAAPVAVPLALASAVVAGIASLFD